MTAPQSNQRRPSRRALARAEDGMTIAEVTIAAFILLLGVMATFQMFDAATRNTFRSEQTQVALDQAQRELEEVRALDHNQVALTSAPTTSPDSNDPRHRVAGGQ